MRINLLSSFAAGIFLTTIICGTTYFYDKGQVSAAARTSRPQTATQPSIVQMKTSLEAAGYTVAKKTSAEDSKPEGGVTKVVLNVTTGMTSIDVGNMLQKAKIIPDAFKFSKDVEKRGLENTLRPGTFVVNSGMSYDQVISTIFKK